MTVACVKVFPKQRNLNLPYMLLSALATILTAVALTLRITLMHLRDDASAAKRAADASGLVLHALVVLPHPENRLAICQGDAHAFPDRLRVFSRERENISQEGFNALIHRAFRPGSLRALPCVFRRGSGTRVQA
jgi:hypothetical protein